MTATYAPKAKGYLIVKTRNLNSEYDLLNWLTLESNLYVCHITKQALKQQYIYSKYKTKI